MTTSDQAQPLIAGPTSPKIVRSYSRHKTNIFIEKTFDMLEETKYDNAISWDEAGTMVVIKDLSAFVSVVLPTVFSHQNFQSFVRQLNLYNFKKVKYKNYQYAYCHPFFQHGRRDLLREVIRQPIYKKKKAKVLIKEGFAAEEVVDQPIRKKLQRENISLPSNSISRHKDIESENNKIREEIMNMKSELLLKEEGFRKFSERNIDLRWRMKIQGTEAMMLLNQLKERMPPTTFELFKAQEYNNIIHMIEPPFRRELLETGYKRPTSLINNPEAMYIPNGINDDQIGGHTFNNEFFANPHIIRQNPINTETEENREGYHLMNPLIRDTRDTQNPIFLQRLDQNALKHYNVFLS